MEFPYLSIIHQERHQNFIRYVEPPQQAGSSQGEDDRREKEVEGGGGKKFAEKCERLFWRPCRKHSSAYFSTFLLHFLASRRRPASMRREKSLGPPSAKIFLRSRVDEGEEGEDGGRRTNASNDFPLKLPAGC